MAILELDLLELPLGISEDFSILSVFLMDLEE
jgi:hypothetical protein